MVVSLGFAQRADSSHGGRRARLALLATIGVVYALVLLSTTVSAQEPRPNPPLPTPAPSPTAPAPPEPTPEDECGAMEFDCKIKQGAKDAFDAVLTGLLQLSTAEIARVVAWGYEGPTNFLFRTPASLTYENTAVREVWGHMRLAANASLVAIVFWGGFRIMVGSSTGTPYHEAMELFPRVVLGVVLVNTSDGWTRLLIDANNALCDSMDIGEVPGLDTANRAEDALVLAFALLVYTVMGLALLLQSLLRIGLLDILIVLSPLALICWILPETQPRARAWSFAYTGAVFTQFIQLVALKVGAGIFIGRVLQPVGLLGAPGALLTAVLGCVVLYLTLKVPKMMHAHVDHPVSFLRFAAYQRALSHFAGGGARGTSASGSRTQSAAGGGTGKGA